MNLCFRTLWSQTTLPILSIFSCWALPSRQAEEPLHGHLCGLDESSPFLFATAQGCTPHYTAVTRHKRESHSHVWRPHVSWETMLCKPPRSWAVARGFGSPSLSEAQTELYGKRECGNQEVQESYLICQSEIQHLS